MTMSSTFRRPGDKARLNLPGTKHWTGGITLTSTGLRDLDSVLGSGQPLGTCIWIDEDRLTNSLAMTLVKYWCAEAVSQDQRLLIPVVNDDHQLRAIQSSTWEMEDQGMNAYVASEFSRSDNVLELLASLPRNLHLDKAKQRMATAEKESHRPLETLGEEEGGEEGFDEEDYGLNNESTSADDEGLKIAWQYRKSVQRERLGQTSPIVTKRRTTCVTTQQFCHSYDLQGNLNDQIDVEAKTTILRHSFTVSTRCSSSHSDAIGVYLSTRTTLQGLLEEGPKSVVRVLFYRTPLSVLILVLPLLMSHVREHELPVVFMVSCRPWTFLAAPKTQNFSRQLIALKRTADVVLEVEGFASRRDYPPPSEFRIFHGLLKIAKCSTVTAATANGRGGHFADMTTRRQLPAYLFGLKFDRRKLHIEMLHIPPEDYVEGGGSVGGGAVRSGAGRPSGKSSVASMGLGCATSGGSLDF